MHLPALVRDLALILMTAGATSLVFQRLRQPVVLGYIVAGFILGRHVPYFPSIVDQESVRVWGEIGVIFLLFVLGLEFSFQRLFRLGAAPIVTAMTEIAAMMGVGYAAGWAFGWPFLDRVFLGGILSISSTTIILKAFEGADVRGKKFVELVFGTLIVEDLIAILLLVLLAALSAGQAFDGTELAASVGRLGAFIVIWVGAALFLAPRALRRISPWLGDETMMLASLGTCFAMVVIATRLGFSPALGAFAMGSILAESRFGERTMQAVEPLKNLFAAVFFVCVGLLMDPAALWEYRGLILVVTVLTIAGKSLATAAGALVSGASLKSSVQAGLSMAQIGEFSFIIAALGLSLGVIGEALYPVAVGVATLTTFTTPYLIRASESVYARLRDWIPESGHRRLAAHQAAMERFGLRVGFSRFLQDLAVRTDPKPVIAPWDAHVERITVSAGSELAGKSLAHAKIRELFGATIAMVERGGKLTVAPNAFEVLFPGDRLHVIGTDAQIVELRSVLEVPVEDRAELRPDVALEPFVLPAGSPFLGRTIRDSGIREHSSALVVGVERDKERTLNPDSALVLREGDVLWLFGDPARIHDMKR